MITRIDVSLVNITLLIIDLLVSLIDHLVKITLINGLKVKNALIDHLVVKIILIDGFVVKVTLFNQLIGGTVKNGFMVQTTFIALIGWWYGKNYPTFSAGGKDYSH